MPALSFSVFQEKIVSGAKRQTIRGVRKNPIKVGDKLFLYWKQQSPKDCRKLGEAICTKVKNIVITKDGYDFPPSRNAWFFANKDEFAIADGFDNWQQLVEYFEKNYSLPFEGVLIQW